VEIEISRAGDRAGPEHENYNDCDEGRRHIAGHEGAGPPPATMFWAEMAP
jgi:hypothetical protein